MTRRLNVHMLPRLTSPQQLAGGTVVVIDVLRATSTIVHALAAGAKAVIPCLEVAEARELARQRDSAALLGGERGGRMIGGFDLGNSPLEYTEEKVANKTIVMTTTNGTRALMLCVGAARVLIGAFNNLSAVCRALADDGSIELLCAGTRDEITREDVLLAGAIARRIETDGSAKLELNDQARIAISAWAADGRQEPDQLAQVLRDSRGGRNVASIGLDHDIATAAQIDKFNCVPELERSRWQIRLPLP